jgi:aminopeptidase N
LYLTRHAYANAETVDLWEALEEVSGKPVKKMMAGYTRQPGYPVLLVKSQEKKGTLSLDLQQKRFLVDGSSDPKHLRWEIPVGIRTHNTEPQVSFMKNRRHRITVPVDETLWWVQLNPGQSGFYRVAYSEELWDRLITAVAENMLPTVDRLGLLDDAVALARAGYWKTSSALRVLQVYRFEKDFSVWMTIAGIFHSLDNLLARQASRERFVEMAREFFAPLAFDMGWEKRPQDGHLDVMLRALALRNFGAYGGTAMVEEARNRFELFVTKQELDPDLRQTVFSLVAENGKQREWEKLRKVYRDTDLQEEKTRVLRAAGACRDKEVLQDLLNFSLSDQVRVQDTWLVLTGAATHPLGRTLAWRFLKRHWKTFLQRYHGGGLNLLNRVIAIPAGFTTGAELADAQDFFRRNRVAGTERAVAKTLEMARSNIRWLERDRANLNSFFARAD